MGTAPSRGKKTTSKTKAITTKPKKPVANGAKPATPKAKPPAAKTKPPVPSKRPVATSRKPAPRRAQRAASNHKDGRRTKFIPLDAIRPDPDQPRRTFHPVDGFVPQEAMDALRELADNIYQEGGLLQPITVREEENGGYTIVAGERRWRAYVLNRSVGRPDSDEIECFIREDTSVAERRLLQLAENLQRQDLSDIDTAVYIKAIMDDYPELQQKNLAALLNKTPQWISRVLGLLDPRYSDVVMQGHIIYASILEQFKALPSSSQRDLHENAKKSGTKITSHQIRQESSRVKNAATPPSVPAVTGAQALQRLGLGGQPGVDPVLLNSVENALASGAVADERYSPPNESHNRQELRLRLSQALRLADVLENLDQNVSIMIDNEDLRKAITKMGGKPPSDDLGLAPILVDLLTRAAKRAVKGKG